MFKFTFLDKSICCFLLIGSLFSNPLFAQKSQEDSLKKIIHQNKNDNSTFRAYKKLGALNEKKNSREAVKYFLHAVSFPFHLEYAKEFVETYNSLGELYHTMSLYDSSNLMCRQALGLAQKFNLEKEIGFAYQRIGLNFMRATQSDSAKFYFNLALPIFIKAKDYSHEGGIYINLGNIFLDEGNYSEALNQYIKGAKVFEGQAHDTVRLASAWVNIGNVESAIGQYDKALDYAKRSLLLFQKYGSPANSAYCHRLIGRILRKQTLPEKALAQYREALTIYEQLSDQRNLSETFQSVGNIYYDINKYTEALGEYEKSLAIARAIADDRLMAFNYSAIGETWFKLKKLNTAIAYLDSGMKQSRKIKNRDLTADAYGILSAIYAQQNRYKEAFVTHQSYSELKDSISNDENRHSFEELEHKYQNAKKQSQIDLLQKDQQLKNIFLQQSRTLQTAMVIAFGLLIAIGFLVINRNRLIHQAKRQMEIERMRNQIARDLHDDIGSTLSSINIVSQLAIKENQTELGIKYFQRIADQSAKMMESMDDMVWSINPENDSLQKMVTKMKEFSEEILEPKNIHYQFEGEETFNGTVLDVAKRKNIFLIFKETVNNAAKYSEGTNVAITITQKANELHLTVHDNGKGFDFMKVKNGNGLGNLKERAREINATLELSSTVGQGTTMKMKLPLT